MIKKFIENMYRVFVKVWKHKWNFRRVRDVSTAFMSFPKLYVSITQWEHREHVIYFFQKTPEEKKKIYNL